MKSKYYLISRKGKTLSACMDYLKRRSAAYKRLAKYAVSLGGDHAGYSLIDGRLLGVHFKGEQPEGWTKKDKHGYSRPKKKSEHYKPFYDTERLPCRHKFSAELTGAPRGFSYKVKGESGSTCTSEPGQWHHTELLWMSKDGPFLIKVPDVNGQIEELRKGRKTFKSSPESWELKLSGCREILYEEWLLMVARRDQKQAA